RDWGGEQGEIWSKKGSSGPKRASIPRSERARGTKRWSLRDCCQDANRFLHGFGSELLSRLYQVFQDEIQIARHGLWNWLLMSLADIQQNPDASDVLDCQRDFSKEAFVLRCVVLGRPDGGHRLL